MSITLDASSSGATSGTVGSGGTLTISHTCTGSNLLLIVGIGGNSVVLTPSTVTYNGVAMSRLQQQQYIPAGLNCELWALVAPATGTHNIVITVTGVGNANIFAQNASFKGARQTGQPETSVGSTDNNVSSVAVNITSSNFIAVVGVDSATGASVITPKSGLGQTNIGSKYTSGTSGTGVNLSYLTGNGSGQNVGVEWDVTNSAGGVCASSFFSIASSNAPFLFTML